MKNKSLIVSFLFPLLITIISIMSFYTIYNYFETKKRLVEDINIRTNSTKIELKDTLPHFINSYAINEYKKLIENQMQDINILAIIVKDYSYGKIFGKEFIETGKIRDNEKVIDFDKYNIKQISLLDENKFSHVKVILKDNLDTQIAEIEIYSSNKYLKETLEKNVKKSLLEIVILSLIITFLVFLIIKILWETK